MGMTIDKTIEFFNGLEGHTPQAKDARNVAIETMRKYQKIEQIMNQEQAKWWGVVKDTWLYKEIREVIEDGNDDCN